MSEQWYQACFGKIEPIWIGRSTEDSVWIGGRRSKRVTDWKSFFPTWADAHAFLLEKASRELLAARRELERAQVHHGNIKGMRPPSTVGGDRGA